MTRAAALQVHDPAAATALWQQIERELLAQAPLVPMYNRSNVDFLQTRRQHSTTRNGASFSTSSG